MELLKRHATLLIFNLAYIVGFGTYFLMTGNYEFLWYVAVMLVLMVLIGTTLRISHLPNHILWMLSAWGLLHMAGGGVRIGDHVLYAQMLIPFVTEGEFSILKYDQFVHMYGFGVAAVAVHFLLSRKIYGYISAFWLSATSVLVAMGLGVINEMIEFSAVLASPSTGVGGYFNTSLDLVFNTIGAIVAMGILAYFGKHEKEAHAAVAENPAALS
jgi:hypothetical protein